MFRAVLYWCLTAGSCAAALTIYSYYYKDLHMACAGTVSDASASHVGEEKMGAKQCAFEPVLGCSLFATAEACKLRTGTHLELHTGTPGYTLHQAA